MIKKLLQGIDARDVHFYLGIALLAVGAGMVFFPAALITSGAVFVFVAIRRVK